MLPIYHGEQFLNRSGSIHTHFCSVADCWKKHSICCCIVILVKSGTNLLLSILRTRQAFQTSLHHESCQNLWCYLHRLCIVNFDWLLSLYGWSNFTFTLLQIHDKYNHRWALTWRRAQWATSQDNTTHTKPFKCCSPGDQSCLPIFRWIIHSLNSPQKSSLDHLYHSPTTCWIEYTGAQIQRRINTE